MIPRSELERRLGITIRALTHNDRAHHPARGVTATRIRDAGHQLTAIARPAVLRAAYQHLDGHQAGYPTNSMPDPTGRGGVSDRTGRIVTDPYEDPDDENDRPRIDIVTREISTLDRATHRLERDSLACLVERNTYGLGQRIETDAGTVTTIITTWSRPPDTRWCTHCLATNGHRAPAGGRYASLCRPCGDWRAVNKKLPHKDILEYLQRGETHRIPRRLLNRERAKIPRPQQRTRSTP